MTAHGLGYLSGERRCRVGLQALPGRIAGIDQVTVAALGEQAVSHDEASTRPAPAEGWQTREAVLRETDRQRN